MRFWPLAFVALGAAIAMGLTVRQHADADKALAQVADKAAAAGTATVQEALNRRQKALAAEAGGLATNEQLRFGIATDAQTIQDQIAQEGLHSLREHDVYAIGRVNPQNPSKLILFASHGFENVSSDIIESSSAVEGALKSPNAPPATGIIGLPVGFALVAAAPVTSPDHQSRGYLLIGDRVSRPSLTPIATETRATSLLISDGARPIAYAGPPEGEPIINAGVGNEAKYETVTLVNADARTATRAIALAPRVFLWVATSVANEADTIAQSTKFNIALSWLGSLGLGLVLAVVLIMRSRKPVAPDATSPANDWAGATGITPAKGQTVPPMPISGASPPAGTSTPGGTVPFVSGGIAPAAAALDPAMFGRYRLLDRLGAGGMAEVWTAVTTGAGGFRRPFVVKRILRGMASNADLVQSFIDEANLGSQLVHSNIVPVFDFGELNGEYYLAQEYILGRDLGKVATTLAERGRRLDPIIATYILTEMLKALDYAHTLTDKNGKPLGIVHRDISPNNILCSKRGEVKLIDFGIAKSVSKVGQTEVGTVKGNLRFMSPEQAQGLVVDARSDIFSLGMSIYFTQTGSSLYSGSGPYDLLLCAAKGPQAEDFAKIEALAPPLGWLLGEALAPAVQNRYSSAQTFLETALPQSPADGARRLAALLMEVFGEEMRAQEQRFSEAIGTSGEQTNTDATVQRPALSLRQGP